MSLSILLSELWRFVREHVLALLAGTLIIAILVTGAGYLHKQKTAEQLLNDTSQASPEEIKAAADYLETAYETEPVSFRFVAMQKDGNQFMNSFVFDEYFRSKEERAKLAQKTGVDLEKWYQSECQLGIDQSSEFRGGLAGVRDMSSGVVTMRVQVGQSEEENMKVAQAMYEEIKNQTPAFAKDFDMTLLEAPTTENFLTEDDQRLVSGPSTLSEYVGLNQRPLLVYAFLGALLGIFATAFVLFLWQWQRGKVRYAFDYSWSLPMLFFLINQKRETAEAELRQAATLPAQKRLILRQAGEPILAGEKTHTQCEALPEDLKELVIWIDAGQTDKAWLQQQFQVAKLWGGPLKVIHVY